MNFMPISFSKISLLDPTSKRHHAWFFEYNRSNENNCQINAEFMKKFLVI